MKSITEPAIADLFDEFPYGISLHYSGRFKPYRANIKLRGYSIDAYFSKKWRTVGKEIQIGLLQELLIKLLSKRIGVKTTSTKNIDLYNIFMKKIHIAAPKDKIDPTLHQSFDRVNQIYFNGSMELTNLVWGTHSYSKLGSYEYGSDTISISRVLGTVHPEILDYVMYHEMLHKKHKFNRNKTRSFHHTKAFKEDEKKFSGAERIERQLRMLAAKGSLKRFAKRLIS